MAKRIIHPFLEVKNMMLINPYIYNSIDPNAEAFLNAAGITDETIVNAINYLVTELKSNNLWNGIVATYPFVGGTVGTHKYNLKDPRDLDLAYRLTFSGSFAHSSTGVDPTGTTSMADTHILINNIASSASSPSALCYYSRENTTGPGGYSEEIYGHIGPQSFGLRIRGNANAQFPAYHFNVAMPDVANSDARGFYVGTRENINYSALYKNDNLIASSTDAANWSSFSNLTFKLFGSGSGDLNFTTNRECALAAFYNIGISAANIIIYNSIVQQFETMLNRNV